MYLPVGPLDSIPGLYSDGQADSYAEFHCKFALLPVKYMANPWLFRNLKSYIASFIFCLFMFG